MTTDAADSRKSSLNPPFAKGGKRNTRGDLYLPKRSEYSFC